MPPKTIDCFAVTAPGLETICMNELKLLGISAHAATRGGVEFAGGLRELYLANLWLRSASRVLVRLGELSARDFPALFQKLSRLPWGRFIKPGSNCRIRVSSRTSRLVHGARIAETCQAAIAKSLGEKPAEAQLETTVFLRFNNDRCVVSIDSSGDLLHRRGLRQARAAAPLRETLAAGCLLACGYDGSEPLVDLMTGSGTFVLEAAMIALNHAPGAARDFAFMSWPRYRQGLWRQLLKEATALRRGEAAAIVGIDNNPKAISAAQMNIQGSDLQNIVELRCGDMKNATPDDEKGMLICNPPYGERLGKNAALAALYHQLGIVYRDRFPGWEGAILCPEGPLIQSTRIELRRLMHLNNGGIPVSLFQKDPA